MPTDYTSLVPSIVRTLWRAKQVADKHQGMLYIASGSHTRSTFARVEPLHLWRLFMHGEMRPRCASQVIHNDQLILPWLGMPGVSFAWFGRDHFFAIEEPVEPIDLVAHRHGKDNLVKAWQGEVRRWTVLHHIVLAIERGL